MATAVFRTEARKILIAANDANDFNVSVCLSEKSKNVERDRNSCPHEANH